MATLRLRKAARQQIQALMDQFNDPNSPNYGNPLFFTMANLVEAIDLARADAQAQAALRQQLIALQQQPTAPQPAAPQPAAPQPAAPQPAAPQPAAPQPAGPFASYTSADIAAASVAVQNDRPITAQQAVQLAQHTLREKGVQNKQYKVPAVIPGQEEAFNTRAQQVNDLLNAIATSQNPNIQTNVTPEMRVVLLSLAHQSPKEFSVIARDFASNQGFIKQGAMAEVKRLVLDPCAARGAAIRDIAPLSIAGLPENVVVLDMGQLPHAVDVQGKDLGTLSGEVLQLSGIGPGDDRYLHMLDFFKENEDRMRMAVAMDGMAQVATHIAAGSIDVSMQSFVIQRNPKIPSDKTKQQEGELLTAQVGGSVQDVSTQEPEKPKARSGTEAAREDRKQGLQKISKKNLRDKLQYKLDTIAGLVDTRMAVDEAENTHRAYHGDVDICRVVKGDDGLPELELCTVPKGNLKEDFIVKHPAALNIDKPFVISAVREDGTPRPIAEAMKMAIDHVAALQVVDGKAPFYVRNSDPRPMGSPFAAKNDWRKAFMLQHMDTVDDLDEKLELEAIMNHPDRFHSYVKGPEVTEDGRLVLEDQARAPGTDRRVFVTFKDGVIPEGPDSMDPKNIECMETPDGHRYEPTFSADGVWVGLKDSVTDSLRDVPELANLMVRQGICHVKERGHDPIELAKNLKNLPETTAALGGDAEAAVAHALRNTGRQRIVIPAGPEASSLRLVAEELITSVLKPAMEQGLIEERHSPVMRHATALGTKIKEGLQDVVGASRPDRLEHIAEQKEERAEDRAVRAEVAEALRESDKRGYRMLGACMQVKLAVGELKDRVADRVFGDADKFQERADKVRDSRENGVLGELRQSLDEGARKVPLKVLNFAGKLGTGTVRFADRGDSAIGDIQRRHFFKNIGSRMADGVTVAGMIAAVPAAIYATQGVAGDLIMKGGDILSNVAGAGFDPAALAGHIGGGLGSMAAAGLVVAAAVAVPVVAAARVAHQKYGWQVESEARFQALEYEIPEAEAYFSKMGEAAAMAKARSEAQGRLQASAHSYDPAQRTKDEKMCAPYKTGALTPEQDKETVRRYAVITSGKTPGPLSKDRDLRGECKKYQAFVSLKERAETTALDIKDRIEDDTNRQFNTQRSKSQMMGVVRCHAASLTRMFNNVGASMMDKLDVFHGDMAAKGLKHGVAAGVAIFAAQAINMGGFNAAAQTFQPFVDKVGDLLSNVEIFGKAAESLATGTGVGGPGAFLATVLPLAAAVTIGAFAYARKKGALEYREQFEQEALGDTSSERWVRSDSKVVAQFIKLQDKISEQTKEVKTGMREVANLPVKTALKFLNKKEDPAAAVMAR